MQHDRPTPQELAEAVREFLQEEILPILDDHRLKFRTLVAINGLGIAERELWATTPPREEDWELARRIRAGDVPENAVALLKEQVAAEAPRLEPTASREVRVRRRLYLMRHAEVSYVDETGRPVNPEHVPLTARGLEQAEAARDAFAGVELDLVVSSDLPRTAETAAIVAPGHEVERWPEFSEWRGGRLDALPPEELEPLFVGALRVTDEDARFLGGESLGEALDRVHPALDRLVAREWNTALAVFHGGVNRIIVSYALSGDRTYFGTFEQAPACINVLDLGDDGWIVRTVNYVPYDPLHPAGTTTMEHLWEELRGYFDR